MLLVRREIYGRQSRTSSESLPHSRAAVPGSERVQHCGHRITDDWTPQPGRTADGRSLWRCHCGLEAVTGCGGGTECRPCSAGDFADAELVAGAPRRNVSPETAHWWSMCFREMWARIAEAHEAECTCREPPVYQPMATPRLEELQLAADPVPTATTPPIVTRGRSAAQCIIDESRIVRNSVFGPELGLFDAVLREPYPALVRRPVDGVFNIDDGPVQPPARQLPNQAPIRPFGGNTPVPAVSTDPNAFQPDGWQRAHAETVLGPGLLRWVLDEPE